MTIQDVASGRPSKTALVALDPICYRSAVARRMIRRAETASPGRSCAYSLAAGQAARRGPLSGHSMRPWRNW